MLEIAIALSSGVEAMYFFSAESLAAATGLACTHLAPLSMALVAPATALGFLLRNLPLTITAQQYSSLYGASFTWSARLRTLPPAIRSVPMGSESAIAS